MKDKETKVFPKKNVFWHQKDWYGAERNYSQTNLQYASIDIIFACQQLVCEGFETDRFTYYTFILRPLTTTLTRLDTLEPEGTHQL